MCKTGCVHRGRSALIHLERNVSHKLIDFTLTPPHSTHTHIYTPHTTSSALVSPHLKRDVSARSFLLEGGDGITNGWTGEIASRVCAMVRNVRLRWLRSVLGRSFVDSLHSSYTRETEDQSADCGALLCQPSSPLWLPPYHCKALPRRTLQPSEHYLMSRSRTPFISAVNGVALVLMPTTH